MKIWNICEAFRGPFSCMWKLCTARLLRWARGDPVSPSHGSWAVHGLYPARQLVCRSACRVDLMSPECIREVIAAQGHRRCLRDVWCFCAAFALPPRSLGALCTPEAHLYCLKLNIKLWGDFSFFRLKQHILSDSFCAGDLAGGGRTERGPDLLVGLIIRA